MNHPRHRCDFEPQLYLIDITMPGCALPIRSQLSIIWHLTVALSGVASANLGGGSHTIDSILRTNANNASEDLVGENLDVLVAELLHV